MNLQNDESAAVLPFCLRLFAWSLFGKTPAGFSEGNGNHRQTMEPTFEKLLVILAEAGVEYVVVGGMAAPKQLEIDPKAFN